MAVITKTFVENNLPSYRSAWTLSFTGVDVVHGSGAFTIPRPALTAKYVYTGKAYEYIAGTWHIYVDGKHYNHQEISYQRGSVNSLVSATSGIGYNIGVGPNDDNTAQLYLSWYFDSNNPTVRSVPITVSQSDVYMASSNASSGGSMWNAFLVDGTELNGVIGYLTLDAPPTFTASALSGDTNGYWAGATTVSTTISSASAKYGGNIVSSSLTIGSQTVSGSGNGTLSIDLANAGTFTPQVSVTDSRGQVTTKTFDAITVNPYLVPSVSFDVYRTNASGVKDDEGHCGLIIGQMTYTDALANLTEPSVSIDGTPIEDVVGATITWYTGYSSSTGVDATTEIDGTNITWADVASGSTVYALIDCDYDVTERFSEGLSYQIGVVANDSIGGHSTTIIQTLSTAFYTIDFQAGGKEIAFGAPANDDVTNYPNGLFKCEMDAAFNGDVAANGDTKLITGDTEIENPYYSLDTAASSGTTDGDLYAGITALGWGNDVIGAGKNKLNASGGSGTVSGVTFTNTNGVIVASGNATASIYRQVGTFTPENGVEYILTGCPSGGANGKYRITLAGYGYDFGNGYTFTGDGQSHNITCDVYTDYPTTGTTLTFKPMIRLSSESDASWQPYSNSVLNNKKVLTKELDALDALKVDYVVEEGTSGNWAYRKWNSGILEQWYESGDTTYAITTARGNLYTGNWLSSTYPIEFVGYPRTSASVSLGTTAYAVFAQVDNRFTDTAWIRGVCGSSIASSSGYHFSIYAIGRWK